MLSIDLVHVPGCDRCASERQQLLDIAHAVAGDELRWRDLSVLEHMEYAVAAGVISLPSLLVNGRLAFSSLPTASQWRYALQRVVAERT